MNVIYAVGLVAFTMFAQSLSAQGCSGGVDGGMDATGNQCNAPATVEAHTTDSVAGRLVEQRPADGSGRARLLAVRPKKESHPNHRSMTRATPVSRFASLPTLAGSVPASATTTGLLEGICSGGADGGMSASGSQCSDPHGLAGHAITSGTKSP